MQDNPALLLHTCCAPCAVFPIKILSENYRVIACFYNPNLYPLEEFKLRAKEMENLCLKLSIPFYQLSYDHQKWLEVVQGYEHEPEGGMRCNLCFEHRLKEVAMLGIKEKIPFFTTTLTISPHKNSKAIFEIGRKIARESGIEFLEMDFKKRDGFKKSLELSKEYGLYRQNYCGCEFSIRAT